MTKMFTLAGLFGTLAFALTHPGHEGVVCSVLAGLYGYLHGKTDGPDTP